MAAAVMAVSANAQPITASFGSADIDGLSKLRLFVPDLPSPVHILQPELLKSMFTIMTRA